MEPVVQSVGRKTAVIRAGNYVSGTQVFAPPMAALLTAGADAAPQVTAKFDVTYHGFSDEAKKAFQAAVDVWAITLSTSVTIRVDATWTSLGTGVLGQAGPENFFSGFLGAPKSQTWYPVALANKLNGADLTPGQPHISASFNSNFPNWHFGTGGATPLDKYDLMSVVLHEIGHGIGFIGSMNVFNNDTPHTDDDQGSWSIGSGFPIIYDRFTENAQGQKLIDTALFPNPSHKLAGQLQSNQLFFNGPKARAANNNGAVRIYAPSVWDGGSSFSHLDEVTFPAGDANSLMTPQIGTGESIHAAGPIVRGVLKDLGW